MILKMLHVSSAVFPATVGAREQISDGLDSAETRLETLAYKKEHLQRNIQGPRPSRPPEKSGPFEK